jgi:aminotransferase
MTRVAIESGAVNLSQGFPNEPPPREMACAAAGALLCGASAASAAAAAAALEIAGPQAEETDALNQYSFPYGAPELRRAVAKYYAQRFPGAFAYDADENITVVAGATEGFAACIRALAEPGDTVAFFEPCHELYPSQLALFGMRPRAVTLTAHETDWAFDAAELEAALRGATLFLFNDPHNPTGHRFSPAERRLIVKLCRKHDVLIVTDEIYEWILYDDGGLHEPLAVLDPENVVVVSSISKTARATGWRIGWVVASASRTQRIRAVHDQLVACVATPLQIGVARLLEMDKARFADLREEYWAKRDVLGAALRVAGFDLGPAPRGAYYWFVGYKGVPQLRDLDPLEAAIKMTREYGVACVPGDNFYVSARRADPSHGQRYLRFAFCRSLGVLQAAGERLAAMGWNPH